MSSRASSADKKRLSTIKQKRILKEIKEISENPVDIENSIYESSPGCYIHINENDITNHTITIIGPQDTPYENGFYQFDFKYHENHPFEAPKVQYLTTDGRVRFNPNLYANGKVCLSILGTWSGPSWEPTMSLRVVCEYLRSILNEKPIHNEPGFESCNGKDCDNYTLYVSSENYGYSIINNLTQNKLKPFSRFLQFKFIENFEKIQQKLNKIKENKKNNLTGTISPYNYSMRFNFYTSCQTINNLFLATYYNIMKKNCNPLISKEMIQSIYDKVEIKKQILLSNTEFYIYNLNNLKSYSDCTEYINILGYINKNLDKYENNDNLLNLIIYTFNNIKNKVIGNLGNCIVGSEIKKPTKLEFNKYMVDFPNDKSLDEVLKSLLKINIDSNIISKNIYVINNINYDIMMLSKIINFNELYD